jgi:Domain of unknown function (DUF4382)
VEHPYVTVRGIELRGRGSADTDSPEWGELAPELANEPRQVDLMGNAGAEILVEGALVPAGSYSEVRLQLVPESPSSAEEVVRETVCREGQRNCLIRGGGRVEPLRLPGDARDDPRVIKPFSP